MSDLDSQEEVIAELRAIAAQRTAEADAMRDDLVALRRILLNTEALVLNCADTLQRWFKTPTDDSPVVAVEKRLRTIAEVVGE